MTPLPALLAAVLAVSAAAQDFSGIKAGAQSIGRAAAQCTGSGPTEQCRCPRFKKVHLAIYQPIHSEFQENQEIGFMKIYGKVNIGEEDVQRGLLLTTTRVRTGKDPEWDPCFNDVPQRIHDLEDMCLVIKEALQREPPKAGALPVFFLRTTDADYFARKRAVIQRKIDEGSSTCHATKKDLDEIPTRGFVENVWSSLGPEARGVMMGHGLKQVCSANDVDGLPDTPLVLMNMEPSTPGPYVLAHEVGHGIGRISELTGQGRSFFPDIPPPNDDIHNVMVTMRHAPITEQELKDNVMLNPFQIRQLCQSPLLGD